MSNRSRLELSSIVLALAVLTTVACHEKDEAAGRPIERPSAANTGSLPVLGKIPEFQLTNEHGEALGTKQLAGKPYLAAFMFTRCPSICPELTRKMAKVDAAVKKAGKELRLVSFSVDPTHDTPEVLLAFAKKHGGDVDNWAFLTGEYKTIAATAEEGFKVGLSGTVDESKPHLGITHGSHLVLVDGQGNLRGYFRSSDEDVAAQVVAALARL